MNTLGQRRAFAKAGAASIDARIAEAQAELKAVAAVEATQRKAAHAARTAPVAYTEAELHAARAIRTSFGWCVVVRVNAKSVTVKDVGTFTMLVARSKVLEVRA